MRQRADHDASHLWQVDVVRLLTFAAVIMVHSLAFTEQPDNRLAAAAMMLLQFGREVFFTLTAFVLVYSSMGRPTPAGKFWGRRILYVAVPYTTWSAIYYAYAVWGPRHLHPSASTFAVDLLDGGAMYHLYFLLVTMQLYLVFPLLRAFVLRTASKAWAVLGVAVVVNLAWLALLQWVPAPSGTASWFWVHAYELLPTYSMYVLVGCYAALHLGRIQTFVDQRQRPLWIMAAVCVAGALAAYGVQLSSMAPRSAASVLQPATALSCVAAIICLYLIGSRWARGSRRHSSIVATLSDLSFGVYLSHPLVLQLLLDHGFGNNGQRLPPAAATIIGWLAAVVGGIALTFLARRSPMSVALTGRPQHKPKPVENVVKPAPTRPSLDLAVSQIHPRSVREAAHIGRGQ